MVMILGLDDSFPIWAHVFSNLAAHLNAAINPIVYVIFNSKIQDGYCNLIRLMTFNRLFKKKKTHEKNLKNKCVNPILNITKETN